MFFHVISEIFLAKSQKSFEGGKTRTYNEEAEYFEKKTISLKKSFLSEWDGAKYASCSWPSC